ncbi:MAG TPA: hypothetical protein VNT79_05840, partial [Phycisphaerae bacterium]|nr:hypothetical protein [Phycisphaerae bacterium]
MTTQFNRFVFCGTLLLFSATNARSEGPFCQFQVPPLQSFTNSPDPTNPTFLLDLAACLELPSGTPLVMNGIGWNLLVQAIGDSWISEAEIHFTDPGNPQDSGLRVNPGFFFPDSNDNQPTPLFLGMLKLEFLGLDPLFLSTGLVRLEFGESFDNGPGPDTEWLEGALFVQAIPPCTRGDVNCDQ